MKKDHGRSVPYSRCHRCGSPYRSESAGQEWPKRCTDDACSALEYHHIDNVGVLMQLVTDGTRIGVLTPTRNHDPMTGFPAMAGGFMELRDRSAEEAACRELWEEILRQLGLPMPREDDVRMLCTRNTGPMVVGRRKCLSFFVNPDPIHVSAFEGFVSDEETTGIEFAWGPRPMAFPSHTYALARYFRDHQGMQVPESHIVQPRTGDPVLTDAGPRHVYDVPHLQEMLDEGVWKVLLEDGRDVRPVAVIRSGEGWATTRSPD